MSRIRAWISTLLREPLVHFLVIGCALFAATAAYRAHTARENIVVTPARVEKLAADYQLQFGEAPSPEALDALIAQFINEEIFYRAGLERDLARDDEIVRRRVVQKMQFLVQDLRAPAEPTEKNLEAFYAAHAGRYTVPERVTFTHIYFSPDKAGAGEAAKRARAVLAALGPRTARAPERGDPFPDAYDYAGFEPLQARRLFGDTEMAKALFTAEVGQWAGPFPSGYGVHLVRVAAREPAHTLALSAVRDRVRADYLARAADVVNEKAFEDLKRRFTVIREDLAK